MANLSYAVIRNVVRAILANHDKLLADRSKPIRLIHATISAEAVRKLLPPHSFRTCGSMADVYRTAFETEIRKQLAEHLLETIE